MKSRPSLLVALSLSCASPQASPPVTPPVEATTFSLRRNTLWGASSLDRKHFAMLDEEVIRVLDLSGDEVWGRRLSIGALQSATFCGGGWFVLGADGSAFLTQDGLAQKQSKERPSFVTLDSHGACAFDSSGVGTWIQSDTRYTSNGAELVSLQKGILSNQSWKVSTQCVSDCPISIWGDFIAVAEDKQISLFLLQDGSPQGSLASGDARIISLASNPNALLLSRDDGSVSLWRGQPTRGK
jgi:hypothetical protein